MSAEDKKTSERTKTYSGLCVGGPLDGSMWAHETKRAKFFKPGLELSLTKLADDLVVEPTLVGTYVWSGTNFWQWEPA